MNWLMWWKKTELDADLLGLEAYLQANLTPVAPQAEFVRELRQSLMSQFPQALEDAITVRQQKLQTGVLVAGGIVGGVFVALSGLRGILSLLGAIGLLLNWIKRSKAPVPTTG